VLRVACQVVRENWNYKKEGLGGEGQSRGVDPISPLLFSYPSLVNYLMGFSFSSLGRLSSAVFFLVFVTDEIFIQSNVSELVRDRYQA